MLALLLARVAELRAGDTWRNICAKLERTRVVEYVRGGARVVQTTELKKGAVELLRQNLPTKATPLPFGMTSAIGSSSCNLVGGMANEAQ